jgi:hypothetical protein
VNKVVFINATTTSGVILYYAVQNVFGSVTIMILFFILVLMALCFAFKLPIELTIPLVLPMIIYSMAYYGEIIPLGGVALIYMAILFAKWFVA